ncbi:PREDICTED: uncharacterized protein LOC106148095 [Chinchilla lanigera]|uniref:uncharacterized protein LOC106148095 n=1 Tax=Chinchilla lanigera TaxID=34839 RepID=UPI000695DE0D|nr:PREDICTED: uncharacterized protein LOC106148095 [Chinchilla lanigera]
MNTPGSEGQVPQAQELVVGGVMGSTQEHPHSWERAHLWSGEKSLSELFLTLIDLGAKGVSAGKAEGSQAANPYRGKTGPQPDSLLARPPHPATTASLQESAAPPSGQCRWRRPSGPWALEERVIPEGLLCQGTPCLCPTFPESSTGDRILEAGSSSQNEDSARDLPLGIFVSPEAAVAFYSSICVRLVTFVQVPFRRFHAPERIRGRLRMTSPAE